MVYVLPISDDFSEGDLPVRRRGRIAEPRHEPRGVMDDRGGCVRRVHDRRSQLTRGGVLGGR